MFNVLMQFLLLHTVSVLVGNLHSLYFLIFNGEMSSLEPRIHSGVEIIIVDEGAELDSGEEGNCYDSLEDVKIGERNSSQRRQLPPVPPVHNVSVSHLTPDNVGDTSSPGDLPGRLSKCDANN